MNRSSQNPFAYGDPTADTSRHGKSTPQALAPGYPVQQDQIWPQLLDECLTRLIFAVRETDTCAHGTSSLPLNTTEHASAARVRANTHQQGSHNVSPVNGDTLQHFNVYPNQSPQHIRASDSHDTSGHHCPGDTELPIMTDQSQTNKVLSKPTEGHSDRQSPPTAKLAYSGSPPDEDRLPKRVVDSTMRPQRTKQISSPTEPNFQYQHSAIPHSSTTVTRATVSTTVAVQPSSLPLWHRVEHGETIPGSPVMIPEEIKTRPASQPAIAKSIALTNNKLLLFNNINTQLIKFTYKPFNLMSHQPTATYFIFEIKPPML